MIKTSTILMMRSVLLTHFSNKPMGKTESTAILTTDTIFSWRHQEYSIHCQCRLRIYQLDFDRVVIIASSLNDYPGVSSAEEVKRLIHRTCGHYGLAINKTMWIDHYPSNHPEGLEFFYQILLVWDQVRSYKIGQHQLEWFLGQRV